MRLCPVAALRGVAQIDSGRVLLTMLSSIVDCGAPRAAGCGGCSEPNLARWSSTEANTNIQQRGRSFRRPIRNANPRARSSLPLTRQARHGLGRCVIGRHERAL